MQTQSTLAELFDFQVKVDRVLLVSFVAIPPNALSQYNSKNQVSQLPESADLALSS